MLVAWKVENGYSHLIFAGCHFDPKPVKLLICPEFSLASGVQLQPNLSLFFFLSQICPFGLCRTWVDFSKVIRPFQSYLMVQMSSKMIIGMKGIQNSWHKYSMDNKAPVYKGGLRVYNGSVRSLCTHFPRQVSWVRGNYFDQQPNGHLWNCTSRRWRGIYSRKSSRTFEDSKHLQPFEENPLVLSPAQGEWKQLQVGADKPVRPLFLSVPKRAAVHCDVGTGCPALKKRIPWGTDILKRVFQKAAMFSSLFREWNTSFCSLTHVDKASI